MHWPRPKREDAVTDCIHINHWRDGQLNPKMDDSQWWREKLISPRRDNTYVLRDSEIKDTRRVESQTCPCAKPVWQSEKIDMWSERQRNVSRWLAFMYWEVRQRCFSSIMLWTASPDFTAMCPLFVFSVGLKTQRTSFVVLEKGHLFGRFLILIFVFEQANKSFECLFWFAKRILLVPESCNNDQQMGSPALSLVVQSIFSKQGAMGVSPSSELDFSSYI